MSRPAAGHRRFPTIPPTRRGPPPGLSSSPEIPAPGHERGSWAQGGRCRLIDPAFAPPWWRASGRRSRTRRNGSGNRSTSSPPYTLGSLPSLQDVVRCGLQTIVATRTVSDGVRPPPGCGDRLREGAPPRGGSRGAPEITHSKVAHKLQPAIFSISGLFRRCAPPLENDAHRRAIRAFPR